MIKEMIFNQCHSIDKKFNRPELTPEQLAASDRSEEFRNTLKGFSHSILFCRDAEEILTKTEATILSKEREKYLSFIRKNYKHKIPEEFTSKRLMKAKALEVKRKQKEAVAQKLK